MRRMFFAFLVSALLHSVPLAAGEAPPDSLETPPAHLQKTLESGMQVIVQSMPDAALVRVGVFFAAGSAVEPDSLAGLAHLSEHLLTESSLNHPDGGLIRQSTLYSTYRNAYTGSAYMQFDTECLPVFLPRILELEADRLRGVTTDSISFEREKGIVLEELAMRQRLSPTPEFLVSVFQACYPGHPFGRDVGGTAETVGKIRVDDFMRFQENHIRPERAALVVKGPVDPEKTMADIEHIFGTGQEKVPEFLETPAYPPITAAQFIADSHDHTGLKVCRAFRVPLQDESDAAFIAILPDLMGKSGIHPTVWSVPGEAVVMLLISGGYGKPDAETGDPFGHVFDAQQQSLGYMEYQWEMFSEAVLAIGDPDVFPKRLKYALKNLDRSRRNPGRSKDLGSSLVNGNEHLSSARIRAIMAEKGPADFMQFMERWFSHDLAVVGVSHGRDSERPAAIRMAKNTALPVSPDATSHLAGLTQAEIEPVLEAYGKAELVKLSRFGLFNGVPVYHLDIPDSEQWAMAGYRTFKGIKDMRPGKKPGLTQVFNRVVNYDPSQRRNPNGPTIIKVLPHHTNFRLNWGSASFSAQGSGDEVEKVINTVSDRISTREFSTLRWYSVTRWGSRYLESIRDRKTNEARAWRWEQLLGSDHPSLGEWAPEPDSFEDFKYKDLSSLHEDCIQETGNLALMVAGDVPVSEVQPLLNRTLGERDSWEPLKPGRLPKPRVEGVQGRIIPDLTRGDILLEISFPLRRTGTGPQPATVLLALENAMDQILTDRLREKEGLTYDVSTSVFAMTSAPLWEIAITCRPGQAPVVLSIFREELDRISEAGFTADEIARVRLGLAGQAVSNFSDPESALDHLLRLAKLGEIPLNPFQEISDVTAGEVNTVARSVLDPVNFVFTATGPLFEEDIDQFNLP